MLTTESEALLEPFTIFGQAARRMGEIRRCTKEIGDQLCHLRRAPVTRSQQSEASHSEMLSEGSAVTERNRPSFTDPRWCRWDVELPVMITLGSLIPAIAPETGR